MIKLLLSPVGRLYDHEDRTYDHEDSEIDPKNREILEVALGEILVRALCEILVRYLCEILVRHRGSSARSRSQAAGLRAGGQLRPLRR